MIEKEVDFWDEVRESKNCDAIVCTTNNFVKNNGSLVMGRGIAAEFSAKFPYLAWNWGQITERHKERGVEDYYLLFDGPRSLDRNKFYVIGMQTKRNWQNDSPIELIIESAKRLKKTADNLNFEEVIMTRPGCGNGGLEWRTVRSKIRKYLDDRFIVCNKNI